MNNTVSEIPVFFIVGRERSGTTLLQSALNAHPNITAPIESPFIKHSYKKYRSKTNWNEVTISKFVDDLLTEPYLVMWNIDKAKLTEALMQLPQYSFANFCKVILAYQSEKQLQLIGDKNPQYSLFCPQLLKVFPKAKFIWVIRDPKAQVNSMLKVNFEKKIVSSLAYRWKHFNRKIQEFQQANPNKVLLIKHEEFIQQPAQKLQEICSFLNIEYHDSMLEDRLKNVANEAFFSDEHHTSLKKEITSEKSADWGKELSPKQVKVIEMITGNFARSFGYKNSNTKFPFGLRIAIIPGLIYGRLYFTFLKTVYALPFGMRNAFFRKFIAPHFKFWKEGKERVGS